MPYTDLRKEVIDAVECNNWRLSIVYFILMIHVVSVVGSSLAIDDEFSFY